ncbi:hypothetical protein U3A58_08095 [Algoriphagus sp. C2-6-M1]|uniref:hypothetical protein n=1 Tax=Algoriphagus persicinus TaxID=3108754 RepID=UPI002B3C8F1F|nr:hypothetical protein [Algoriphagus sp. C2-6-M1]MEB2780352.1 hypothetical protein [Algoriphagus sp. C2-6-M1]
MNKEFYAENSVLTSFHRHYGLAAWLSVKGAVGGRGSGPDGRSAGRSFATTRLLDTFSLQKYQRK